MLKSHPRQHPVSFLKGADFGAILWVDNRLFDKTRADVFGPEDGRGCLCL